MLFYFSATGNSLAATRQIASKMNDEYVSILDCLDAQRFRFHFAEGEKIGFIFPCYFWGCPSIVTSFIAKLDASDFENRFVFIVMTCGSISGSALSDSVRLFAMKGIRISAAHRVLMPENYVIFFNVPSEDKLRRRLVKSDRTLAQIIHSIYEKGDTHLPTPLSRLLALPSRAFHGYYLKHRSTAPFHVSNKCIHCGLCAQICPSHAIRMENNRPTWHGACTQCLGCLNRCPIAAINYGRKTQKRGRYVHPDGMGRTSSPGRAN